MADLQSLATNIRLRRGYDNSLVLGSIGNRFHRPPPTETAIFVESPSRAAAFPDLRSPVVAVGRNCEHKCYCCRNHHSAQHSNQKYTSHFVFDVAPIGLLLHGASGRFCCATHEVYFALSFAVAFPTFPLRSNRSFCTNHESAFAKLRRGKHE
jgi:hypothetical protein